MSNRDTEPLPENLIYHLDRVHAQDVTLTLNDFDPEAEVPVTTVTADLGAILPGWTTAHEAKIKSLLDAGNIVRWQLWLRETYTPGETPAAFATTLRLEPGVTKINLPLGTLDLSTVSLVSQTTNTFLDLAIRWVAGSGYVVEQIRFDRTATDLVGSTRTLTFAPAAPDIHSVSATQVVTGRLLFHYPVSEAVDHDLSTLKVLFAKVTSKTF